MAANMDPEFSPRPSRRPILTRREQTIIAFLLALLIVGGIVLKLRTEWPGEQPAALRQP